MNKKSETPESFRQWWRAHNDNYRAILFDIDGTLVAGPRALPGANELLVQLRGMNFPFCLLTNDGNHSLSEKSRIMSDAGLRVDQREIVSCSMALKGFVEKNHYQGNLFFVMGSLGNPCFAEWAGLKVCRDVRKISECKGVIVGEGFYDWHLNINAVFNFLAEYPDRPLVTPNPDSYWPNGKSGEFGIGAGGKTRFITTILEERGIVVKPVYLGKPYRAIYEYAITGLKKRFDLDSIDYSEILMLGDSLKSDMRGANWLGMTSGLVLSGITTPEMAASAANELKPDLIFSDLS